MQSVNCNSSIFFTIVQKKDKGEMEPEESEPENPFIGTWIGLYNGSIIVFNEDNSFTLGTLNGSCKIHC